MRGATTTLKVSPQKENTCAYNYTKAASFALEVELKTNLVRRYSRKRGPKHTKMGSLFCLGVKVDKFQAKLVQVWQLQRMLALPVWCSSRKMANMWASDILISQMSCNLLPNERTTTLGLVFGWCENAFVHPNTDKGNIFLIVFFVLYTPTSKKEFLQHELGSLGVHIHYYSCQRQEWFSPKLVGSLGGKNRFASKLSAMPICLVMNAKTMKATPGFWYLATGIFQHSNLKPIVCAKNEWQSLIAIPASPFHLVFQIRRRMRHYPGEMDIRCALKVGFNCHNPCHNFWRFWRNDSYDEELAWIWLGLSNKVWVVLHSSWGGKKKTRENH